ncbi:MAG: helix-turn-helix domain-containing protein [Oscillospiraceae bacterium]|nr:helix-turn-helix domain-containing protein [Oscillospiraceae bacterium]
MSIFSDRLVSLMRQKGITQKQLSAQINITPSAMSYYANGSRTPSGEILTKIAKALGTSTDYLLGITDAPQTSAPNPELHYLQRNLGKLDPEQLRKAETLLKTVFDDIFADEEE